MRWADLVLSYLRVVIWPVVTVSLLLIFRHQVATILSRFADRVKELKSVKALGAELDFEQALLDTKRDLASAEPALASSPDSVLPPTSTEDEATTGKLDTKSPEVTDTAVFLDREQPIAVADLATLAVADPGTTVLDAWNGLENTIHFLYTQVVDPGERGRGRFTLEWETETLIDALPFDNPGSVRSAIRRLLVIRNIVAAGEESHEESEIGKLEAYDYAMTAGQTSHLLTRAFISWRVERQRDESPHLNE